MAKVDGRLRGNFQYILNDIETTIMNGSMSVSLEERSDFHIGDVACAVRVYERYSYLGQNRVSMSVTLLGSRDEVFISAITSGGSQAVFFKINTFGEESFLDTVRATIEKYR